MNRHGLGTGARLRRPPPALLFLALLLLAPAAAACRDTPAADAAGAAPPLAGAAPDGPPPDILVVLLDAARPDHFGAYGYARETTPNIDRLAAESLVFRQARGQLDDELVERLRALGYLR